jgi:integration host factor subunit beta
VNKSDLIQLIAERASISGVKAETIVNAIFDAMTEALLKNERIEIRDFGAFEIRHYNAYQGRNPRSGAVIHVQEKRLPHFKSGKELRERLRSKVVAKT